MSSINHQTLRKIKWKLYKRDLTLSRDKARQIVAVVHIDSARASSAAANFAWTLDQKNNILENKHNKLNKKCTTERIQDRAIQHILPHQFLKDKKDQH